MRRLQFALVAVLIATAATPLRGAAPGSISGLVRDSTGTPQIGAEVQLLRPDLSVIASVYTNSNGHFVISSIVPGRYAVKAMGAWFLPSLREDIRVRTNTMVNLTLNTLYEAMQWLPAEPRAGDAQKDDWAWTLRSASNRPLLRWLEDGPLVVVSDGSGAHRRLKARLLATGEEGVFSESGERISVTVEETPTDSRELLAHVEFAPNTDAGMESMLGFRQDLGFAGSVQSVAAVAVHPEVTAGGAEALNEAAVRTWETIHLGDEFDAEVGSNEVLARLSSPSDALIAMLPFASVGWIDGNSAIRYRMATMIPGTHNADGADETQAQTWLPAISASNGALAIQRGRHHEFGWERRTDLSGLSVMAYTDRIDNPVVEAMGHFTTASPEAAAMLVDPSSGLIHATGPGFSSTGIEASFEHRLPGENHLRFDYARGEALEMVPKSPTTQAAGLLPASVDKELAGLHPHRTQAFTLSLSGTLEGTGTRWRASYRWQPEETVTQVAPCVQNAAEPYLDLHLRQPIHLHGDGSSNFEAVLDVSNPLVEGYRPYLFSDGSLLIFAQEQRGVRVGLAFSF